MASNQDVKSTAPPSAGGGGAAQGTTPAPPADEPFNPSRPMTLSDGTVINPDHKSDDFDFKLCDEDLAWNNAMANAAAAVKAAKSTNSQSAAQRDQKTLPATTNTTPLPASLIGGSSQIDPIAEMNAATQAMSDAFAGAPRNVIRLVMEYWYVLVHTIRVRDYTGIGEPCDNELFKRLYPAPLPDGVSVRSITVSFRWMDQGWGNFKGLIWLKLLRPPPPPPPLPPLPPITEAERIARAELAAMGIDPDHLDGPPIGPAPPPTHDYRITIAEDLPFATAAHDMRAECFTFDDQTSDVIRLHKPGDSIEVWKHVGGGGGHRLTIHHFAAVMEFVLTPKPYYLFAPSKHPNDYSVWFDPS